MKLSDNALHGLAMVIVLVATVAVVSLVWESMVRWVLCA